MIPSQNAALAAALNFNSAIARVIILVEGFNLTTITRA